MRSVHVACASAVVCVLLAATPGSRILHVDDDAPGDPAPSSPHVGDPLEDGSPEHPFDSIAEAIAAAQSGDLILLEDGVYQGPGNRELDFAGKALTLRSKNGAPRAVINAQARGRAFVFRSGEGPDARLEGLVIGNGFAPEGGGILITRGSRPTITGCIFLAQRADRGAALRSRLRRPPHPSSALGGPYRPPGAEGRPRRTADRSRRSTAATGRISDGLEAPSQGPGSAGENQA
jgi:hypothetical protein